MIWRMKNMKNNIEIIYKIDDIIREKGYLYFVSGQEKGTIDGIYRTKMGRNKKCAG